VDRGLAVVQNHGTWCQFGRVEPDAQGEGVRSGEMTRAGNGKAVLPAEQYAHTLISFDGRRVVVRFAGARAADDLAIVFQLSGLPVVERVAVGLAGGQVRGALVPVPQELLELTFRLGPCVGQLPLGEEDRLS